MIFFFPFPINVLLPWLLFKFIPNGDGGNLLNFICSGGRTGERGIFLREHGKDALFIFLPEE